MCLIGCLAVLMPRMLIVWLWGFYDYFVRFETWYWPFLGFIFMPKTTLVYAFVLNDYGGDFSGWRLLLLIIAVVLDFGANSSAAQRKREQPTGR